MEPNKSTGRASELRFGRLPRVRKRERGAPEAGQGRRVPEGLR